MVVVRQIPPPHIPWPPTLLPPRQLLFRLPSGGRLTAAYQPLAHHTAGTEKEGETEREREKREKGERESAIEGRRS